MTKAHQMQTDDLTIRIRPNVFVQFQGTSAQLVAEGLIPENFEWPERDATVFWKTDKYKFSVQRVKPQGTKIPKGEWMNWDKWYLSRESRNGNTWQEVAILEKMAEIVSLRQGIPGEMALFDKCWAAREDKDFQAFKALVPGLVRPKRARKPKQAASN